MRRAASSPHCTRRRSHAREGGMGDYLSLLSEGEDCAHGDWCDEPVTDSTVASWSGLVASARHSCAVDPLRVHAEEVRSIQ